MTGRAQAIVVAVLALGVIGVSAATGGKNAETQTSASSAPVINNIPPQEEHNALVVNEPIPVVAVGQDDPGLPVGQTRILKQGTPGVMEVTYDIVTLGGREVRRGVLSQRVTLTASNSIVGNGSYRPPAQDSPSDGGYGGYSGGDLDCADVSYAEAQGLIANGDPHGLDGDGDGEACESSR